MIYITNYSALNSRYMKKNDFSAMLYDLIGKNMIVFTECGVVSGILTEVLKDSIRLRQWERNTVITVMIKHITAVSYHYI